MEYTLFASILIFLPGLVITYAFKYYFSENLEIYINSNPDRFQLLWNKDRVTVYQIDVPKK